MFTPLSLAMPSITPNLRKYLKVVTLFWRWGEFNSLQQKKNGLKFIQQKKLMRITIVAEEELTHQIFAGFKNIFAMSGLGSVLDVLLDEGVDAFVAISAVVDLDGVTMVAQMNARTLSSVIAVDVKDFDVAWCNAPGRHLTNPSHKSGSQREGTTNGKKFLVIPSKSVSLTWEVR